MSKIVRRKEDSFLLYAVSTMDFKDNLTKLDDGSRLHIVRAIAIEMARLGVEFRWEESKL